MCGFTPKHSFLEPLPETVRVYMLQGKRSGLASSADKSLNSSRVPFDK